MALRLGVNVDHVATVRQARLIDAPDPLEAALLAMKGGADSIVAHLREDRRHIQDDDIRRLKRAVPKLNMEMAVSDDVVAVALEVRPERVTLVPENRRELTTEGGLEVAKASPRLKRAIRRFLDAGVTVSLFIAPHDDQVRASFQLGVHAIELHTGRYANLSGRGRASELKALAASAARGASLGLEVAAGHGLNLLNVSDIVRVPEIEELNIGHSIVGRAMMVGMEKAVREMKELMKR